MNLPQLNRVEERDIFKIDNIDFNVNEPDHDG